MRLDEMIRAGTHGTPFAFYSPSVRKFYAGL